MNKTAGLWAGLLLVALAGASWIGCAGSDAADDKKADAGAARTASQQEPGATGADEDDETTEEAVPVEVVALDRGRIESVLRFSSNLEAEQSVGVFARTKDIVTDLLVEEGARVEQGQILLRLRDVEQRSAVEKVRSQLAKAEREYSNQDRLYRQKLISEEAFNNATFELEQLNISLRDAERELGYTEVRAPIRGTVTSRLVNRGDQVQIGQHVFDLVNFDSLVALVFVPEKYLAQLRPGLPARLSTQSYAAGEYVASIERIAPMVDPKSGTVKVTVDVGAQRGLLPGMYVDVELVTAVEADAVLVPKRALVYDDDQTFVYRLGQEDRVERVFVEARITDREHVAAESSLDAGDRVVVAGQAGLKDGALVVLPGPTNEAARRDEAAERASL